MKEMKMDVKNLNRKLKDLWMQIMKKSLLKNYKISMKILIFF